MRIRFMQNLIDMLRGKRKALKLSEKVRKNNSVKVDKSCLYNTSIYIEGENNTIIIEPAILTDRAKLEIYICGDNNSVVIKEGFCLSEELRIQIGLNHQNFGRVENSTFNIGANTSIESAKYFTYNSNTFCDIGSDCMFASDITVYNTDGHPVFDKNTGEVINKVKGITIGNHCWIGAKATILKNSVLPNDSILGWGSVYAGKNSLPNCAYAGNPAKMVKQSITWDPNGAKCGYIDNIREKSEVK